MRSRFPGYYTPSDADFTAMWSTATFVLDANVLLDMYRVPPMARDEFLGVLERIKDRLWVPHQAALEFQRNRVSAIVQRRRGFDKMLQSAGSAAKKLRTDVEEIQIDKYELGIEADSILKELEGANSKLFAAIQAVHEKQLHVSSADPVRDLLDGILEGRVGEGPASQDALDSMVADGPTRYQKKIPPGYSDADKANRGANSTYIHNGIEYDGQFGDLILWRQMIEFACSRPAGDIIFITRDSKEDWWWEEDGKVLGPHPELVAEILKKSPVTRFWMYPSPRFWEQARRYLQSTVSAQAVEELQKVIEGDKTEAAEQLELDPEETGTSVPFMASSSRARRGRIGFRDAFEVQAGTTETDRVVGRWLISRGLEVDFESSPVGADLIVETPVGTVELDVTLPRRVESFLKNGMVTGMLQHGENRRHFTGRKHGVVICLSVSAVQAGKISLTEFLQSVQSISARFPESVLIPGMIEKKFYPFAVYSGDDELASCFL